jgi:hypothetical protein
MVKDFFSVIFGWTAENSPQASGQADFMVGGLNPFVGRWQGTNTLGAFCEADFSADGRFSSVMQSAWGPVHQRGVYRIVDDKTIWFVSVPDTHIRSCPVRTDRWSSPTSKDFRKRPTFTNSGTPERWL